MAGGRRQFGYALHESTQRGLCRLVFVLLGLGPLGVCCVFSAAQFVPYYQRLRAARCEQWLSSQIGVDVEVAALENKTPARFALHGVRLVHPETRATIGRVPLIEVEMLRGQWSIQLTRPELEGRQLSAAWRIVHDWFLCRPKRYTHVASIGMDGLTIRGSSEVDAFAEVAVKLLPARDALLLEVNFRLANSEAAANPKSSKTPFSQLSIRRNHRENQLMTDLQLRANSPLPCWLVDGLLPSARKLGDYATFQGSVGFQMSGAAWHAELGEAHFQQVDFGRLSQDSGVAVSGMGTLYLNSAVLAQRRLEFALGTVMLGPGRIGTRLLTAMGQHLDIEVRSNGSASVHAFDAAAVSIQIEPAGVKIAGRLAADALLTDSLGAIAERSQKKWEERISVAKIAEAFQAGASPNSSNSAQAHSAPARYALQWLPLENPPQRTAAGLRLSQTH